MNGSEYQFVVQFRRIETKEQISNQIENWLIANLDANHTNCPNWFWQRSWDHPDSLTHIYRICVITNMTEVNAALFRLTFSNHIVQIVKYE